MIHLKSTGMTVNLKGFVWILSMEEALFRITITSANFLQNWFGLRFCLAIQI